jgi:hypothetical protein
MYGCGCGFTCRGRKGILENGGRAERWNEEDDAECIVTRAVYEWVG